jgi:hypothetical protein
MADQAIYSPMRVLDANGDPVPGALVYFYATGTTTLIDVFTDLAATTLSTNPVVADADGNLPQRFVEEDAKVVFTTAAGATIRTIDPVPVSPSGGSGASQVSFSPSANIPVADVQAAIDLVDANARARDAALGDLAALDTVGTAQVTASALVTEAEGLNSSDNDTSWPTTAAVKDYVDDTALGVGQTWQGPVRALATTYENTTGRPIQLCITIVGNGGAGSGELLLGATSGGITKRAGVTASGASILATLPGVIIPPGWFYRVNQTSGTIAVDSWSELRV